MNDEIDKKAIDAEIAFFTPGEESGAIIDLDGFSKDQLDLLNEPLLKEHVKSRDGTGNQKLSYLASFHVINEANRIFGFGMWDTEILSLSQCDRTEYEKDPYKAGDPKKEMVSISYLCKLRLTINCGDKSVIKEDVGLGNGVAGKTAYGITSCIELASKEAVTDSLKRCMRYFGNQFGLSLYDKDANPLMELGEFEASKTVTEDQLTKLRGLYAERDINDDWVLAALKAENYPMDTLEQMRQDWYLLAMRITTKYRLDEITASHYERDIVEVIEMMGKSVNMNMLKALFSEAWRKMTAQEDKERMIEVQKTYESMKEEFEKADKK
jgi:DNA recombination protein Rad52